MPRNPYYLVNFSPWPLFSSGGGFVLAVGFVSWLHSYSFMGVLLGVTCLIFPLSQWWRDVMRESEVGYHTSYVEKGMTDGFLLFLISEVMFFFSFFWAFFHMSLAPDIAIGCLWPPMGLKSIDPFKVPLCGTSVLVSSGCSLMYAHSAVRAAQNNHAIFGVVLTVLLGCFFTLLQGYEYYWSSFTIADSVYGSLFYIMTGFHGTHVLVGTGFLLVTLVRLINCRFTPRKHYGFKVCSWYWHFVDVVWIFLYLVVYVWGS
uniref:Cytochrome c oxidase subunit 3 n=1 Tax=Modiolus philippinarum TaxID=310899 RepID=A0A1Z2WWU6_9BIVA|nr:cytochrome oxidase subunit 3 [Modiolus philippinarum]ASB29973.1 cytochrome oxidase subunit 3 [Modiolus philippinarum]